MSSRTINLSSPYKRLFHGRSQAQQLIADIGGINGDGVAKLTDYLVVGQQDYRVVGEDGMSSKQEKAIKYIEQGSEIEILSKNEFTRNI